MRDRLSKEKGNNNKESKIQAKFVGQGTGDTSVLWIAPGVQRRPENLGLLMVFLPRLEKIFTEMSRILPLLSTSPYTPTLS